MLAKANKSLRRLIEMGLDERGKLGNGIMGKTAWRIHFHVC